MRLPRRLTTIAAVGCLALTAAGCGGTADPAPTSTAIHSGASRSANSESKSARPAVTTAENDTPSVATDAKEPSRSAYAHIDKNTELGAADAVEYFAETYLYGLQTGDPSFFDQTYASVCTTCINMKRRMEDPAQRLSNVDWKANDTRVGTISATRIEASTHITADATLAKNGHRGRSSFYVSAIMDWRDGKWVAIDAAVRVDK